jgi:uncharacterized oligopeptide transporter (OPT) family protein
MSDSRPPETAPYRELTWEAVVLGVIQGVILNLAFCYAALKLGFSLGGSTVAAIMGYALLRGVLRKGTMVENNINQTIASGINTAGTGIIFTVPALFLIQKKWADAGGPDQLNFDALPLAIAGVAGAILGVVVIVPLRKQMIEMDRLRFPTGVAVTTIIRAGSSGLDKAKLLLLGVVISAVWKILMITQVLEPGVNVYLTTEDSARAEIQTVSMAINRKAIEATSEAARAAKSEASKDGAVDESALPKPPRLTDEHRVELMTLASGFFEGQEVEQDKQRKQANAVYDALAGDSGDAGAKGDIAGTSDKPTIPEGLKDARPLTDSERVQLYEKAAELVAVPTEGLLPINRTGLELTDDDRSELHRSAPKRRKDAIEGVVSSARGKVIAARGFGLMHEEFSFDFGVIPKSFYPVVYLSLMNLAAGMLAGRGGLPFFFGGLLSWWLISPFANGAGWVPSDLSGDDAVGFTFGTMIRPLGIGTLVGGALMGVVMSFPAIMSALRSLSMAAKTSQAGGGQGGDELSLKTLIRGTAAALLLFFTASLITEGVTLWDAVLSAIVGTIWLGLAALIVAQATGMTDISPMSGMTLISVTLMMVLLRGNIAAAMVVGVAVCVAIGQGADMMQDLKTGHMIGARPIKQQIVQFASTWLGALVALGAVYVLWQDGAGFGPDTPLPAPQAGVLAGIVDAVKSGNVPVDKYAAGGLIGAILGAAPTPGLGVMIGLAMYLPFPITFGYGIGCLCQMGIERVKGADFCDHKLVPLSAGLIVGEALTGMIDTFIRVGIDKLT